MSVGILPMSAVHVAGVAAIARASMPEAWSEAGFASELDKPSSLALVVLDGERPMGFGIGSVAADELEIVTIAVEPSARGRGLGRALLSALLASADVRGARVAHLEVRASNVAAIALYARAGFSEVGRRPRYYADGEDALLMASARAT